MQAIETVALIRVSCLLAKKKKEQCLFFFPICWRNDVMMSM